jgi:hypothetical protein
VLPVPSDVFGLPLHPLIVHATVVFVPAAAVLLLLSALVPRFRRWAGLLTPGVALVALALVPLSTSSGENLERQVGASTLVQQHSHLADGLLPWMIGVAVLAVGVYLVGRFARRPSKAIAVVVAVLSVVVAVGTTVQVVRIGHSGAKAAWSQVAARGSSNP